MFRSHRTAKTMTLLFVLLTVLLACGVTNTIQGPGSLTELPAPRATEAPLPVSPGEASIEVYFTDPQEGVNRGGPDSTLAEAIDAATVSVEVAAYELDLWSIRDALLDAYRRGLPVRLVVESERNSRELDELEQAGIPIVGDGQEGLMHNKFVIIDRSEVWTGSVNYTVSDMYRNNNNLLRIQSSDVAALYLAEFDEMFDKEAFGQNSPTNATGQDTTVGGILVEVYFSPDDGAAAAVEEVIRSAQESIVFLAFSFTNDDLAEAIVDRLEVGVEVRGVLDEGQIETNTGGDFDLFREAGVEVLPDGSPDRMHHKVIIVDGKTVITGSYNFSISAETRNDENLLVIHDPDIARSYLDEFERRYAEASQ